MRARRAASGAIEWMCLPRYDGPSVFGALLDRDAGTFRLGPADTMVPAARRYLPGTMILETTWGHGPRLADRPRRAAGRPLARQRRALDDAPPRAHRLRRRPRPAAHGPLRERHRRGPARVRPDLRLRPPLRALGVRRQRLQRGRRDRRGLARPSSRSRPTCASASRAHGCARSARSTTATPRSSRSRSPTTRARRPTSEAYDRLVKTADYWHQWLAHGTFPDHPWRQYLQRSALTLKGLTYSPTGAMIAAATTSLPETPGGVRNWDYRYSLGARQHVHALGPALARLRVGGQRLLLLHAGRRPGGRPAGDVRHPGRARADRGDASTISAATTTPVPCASATAPTTSASTTCGARCWTRSSCTRSHATICPERRWPLIERLVEAAIENWQLPDRGIWEVRGEDKHFISSKVMCWVACDRGARLARLREAQRARRALAGATADEIKADIIEHGCKDGVFTQHYDTDGAGRQRAADPARALPAVRPTSGSARRCWRSPTT